MMKKLKSLLFGGIITAMLSANAGALLITPTSGFLALAGSDTSQAAIDKVIDSYFLANGLGCVIEEVYKQDVGGAERGPYAGSYTTQFFNEPTDPEDATITWVPETSYINPVCSFLLIKDGKQDPAWYLFDLDGAGWDGMETLDIDGFWPQKGAISHIAIYSGSTVPDGGHVVMLFGTALLVIGTLRRFIFPS